MQTVEYFAIYFLTLLIGQYIKGIRIAAADLKVILLFILPYFLFAFCSVLGVNVLSVLLSGKIATVTYIVIITSCTVAESLLSKNLIFTVLNPVYHLLLPRHILPNLFNSYIDMVQTDLVSLRNFYSYIYFAVAFVIIFSIGAILINNRNLLLRKERQL